MSRAVTVIGGPSSLRQIISVGTSYSRMNRRHLTATMRGRIRTSCCCPRWDHVRT